LKKKRKEKIRKKEGRERKRKVVVSMVKVLPLETTIKIIIQR